MKDLLRLMKLLSDETRVRTLLLLGRKELCVCQIMAVLGVSQPLVSRNLALLEDAGLLAERRQGKLVFYSLRKDLPPRARRLMLLVRDSAGDDPRLAADLESLRDCEEYQRRTGRCDMKVFLEFMEKRKKKKTGRTP
ncbi:MAG: metalloregulator ArsR/SmtB family transcription factor [Thermodesulfovibrionales bacterium]